ncbi:MAG: M20/M25/M40 family metallo-hydrolase, partial [Bacilli bacterium]
MMERLREKFEAIYLDMVAWRRDFHQHPELSFHEHRTPSLVAERLGSWGIDVKTGVGGNGVVGLIKGKYPGPTVALRADMDALPIHDLKDVPYRSKIDGIMHACGHDAHTSILLGIAKIMSEQR